jgi:hypothetical protein
MAPTTKERDLAATMGGWAAANPAEALAMLDRLPEELKCPRTGLAESVVAGLATNDPKLAADLVLRLANQGDGGIDRLTAIVAAEVLRTSGPEEASQWSESLPQGAVKSAAMARVAVAYARQDAEAAARWAEQHAGEDYAAARSSKSVASGQGRIRSLLSAGWKTCLKETHPLPACAMYSAIGRTAIQSRRASI